MKIISIMAMLLLCQGCQPDAGSSSRILDDWDQVVHLELHPEGTSKVFVGHATADPSHQTASSWQKMKAEMAVIQPDAKRFMGFRKLRAIPGFGASVVLMPDSYSQAHPWVIICNEPSMYVSPAECAIKGNSGKWTAQVLISSDDFDKFDAIVESITKDLGR